MPTLKELRKRSYLNQEALATKANMARETINRYETGRATPSPQAVQALAKALKVKPDLIQFTPQNKKGSPSLDEERIIKPQERIDVFLLTLDNGIRDILQDVPNRTIRKFFGDKSLSEYILKIRAETKKSQKK